MAYELYCVQLQGGDEFNVLINERKVGKETDSVDQRVQRIFQATIILKYHEVNWFDTGKVGKIWFSLIYIFNSKELSIKK